MRRMTQLTRLLGCALISAVAAYACGDDGSSKSPETGGEGGEDASAGERGSAAGSEGGGTKNVGGEPSAGGRGSAGEAPQAMAGSGAGGAEPDSGQGGAGGVPEFAPGGAGGAGGAGTCELGEAASAATNQALDLFGTVVYFDDGAELPAGRYRVTYVDGCMKYASSQDWTIHAYANGATAAWWLVGADSSQRIVVPPGTVGWNSGNGAHTTFEACVAANAALGSAEFDFAGGKLGVWLLDSNYGDNVTGEGGRNPKWKLTLLGDCVD